MSSASLRSFGHRGAEEKVVTQDRAQCFHHPATSTFGYFACVLCKAEACPGLHLAPVLLVYWLEYPTPFLLRTLTAMDQLAVLVIPASILDHVPRSTSLSRLEILPPELLRSVLLLMDILSRL
jgi:hypothetical protein